ncbi:enoyl-CoA hydratase [Acrocarpospora pleiomorpha]|uniref:Enoyl-CoA hydratase n=1 Tax=Acrocarpospora pleiomorpha TaxID=90975 RepID=A0A5M3X6J1_9ACTN|nr:enoyl-CoA hydratase-related protein [Acrocarpospora pleiomorpha]GES17305.1 enoyl-CoA hydratase [Acrocarpospora pleiomorpha]
MTDTILVDRPRPGVAMVTLNRPESLNSLNNELFVTLADRLQELDRDREVKVIVLTGAGRGFCAGHDLTEVQAGRSQSIGERLIGIDDEVRCLLLVHSLTTPTIAAVNGPARGGGMSIAVACDMRVASTAATFGVAFVNIGISSGDAGLSWTLPRLVGSGVAAELMLTGRVVDADEALRLGLVNRVAPADRLLATALDLADQIAAHDMLAIWMTKRALNASGGISLEDAVRMENTAQIIAMDSETAQAKITEFFARRDSGSPPRS